MQGSGGKCMSILTLDHYTGEITSSIQQDLFFQAKLLISVMKISGSSLYGRHVLIGSRSSWKNHALRTSSSPGCLTGATRYSQISRLALSSTTSRQPSKHSFDFHTSSVLQKQFGLHNIARKLPISAIQRLRIGRHPTASITGTQSSSSFSNIYRPPPDDQCEQKPTSSSQFLRDVSEHTIIFVVELLLFCIVMIPICGYLSFDSDTVASYLIFTDFVNRIQANAVILQYYILQERHLSSDYINEQTCPCSFCEAERHFAIDDAHPTTDHSLEQQWATIETFSDRHEHDFWFNSSVKRKVSMFVGGTFETEVRWNSKSGRPVVFQTLVRWGDGKPSMWFFVPVPEDSEEGMRFLILKKVRQEADT